MIKRKKLKRSLLLFSIMAAMFSCKVKENTGNRLSPKDMQNVLQDIAIAETYSTMEKDSVYKGGIKNLDSLAVHYKNIFEHYKITQAQFSESLEWYKNHPEDLDTLCGKMMNVVTKWQGTVH